MVKIRNMETADVDGVRELMKEISGLLVPHSKYIYRILAECFSNTCFVAEDDGKIIGFLSGFVYQSDPSAFFMWQYGLLEPYRRSNVPVRMLMNMASNARKLGCRKLRFTIEEGSDQSNHFLKLLKSFNLVKGDLTRGNFVEDIAAETDREFVEILYEVPLSLSPFSKSS